MPNVTTLKRSTALIACAAALFAAGCGSGGAKSTTTNASGAGGGQAGTTSTDAGATTTGGTSSGNEAAPSAASSVERQQACAFATEAETVYHEAAARAGLKFENKPLMQHVITTAGQLRSRLQQLRPLMSGPQASQLAALDAALAQQEVVIAAIVRKDFHTAGEHARGLNEGLSTGIANLTKMCTGL